MTSNAIVRLLLGLVFIVIIVFLLNGLPFFLRHDENKIVIPKKDYHPGLVGNYGIKFQAPLLQIDTQIKLKKSKHKKAVIKIYVVKEGDSLWKIATKELGNGNRYPEIIKINSSVLKDEDNLIVGMRLKIPIK